MVAKTLGIVEPILLLALLGFVIAAYRSTRTTAFMLMMFGVICYVIPQFIPWSLAAVGQIVPGTSRLIHAWFNSWWSFGVHKTFDFLFVVFMIFAFIAVIRERRTVATPTV